MNPLLKRRFEAAASLLALVVLIAGCTRATPIKKILDDPHYYGGRTVTIEGTVTAVMSLVFLKYFTVKDNTGEITVVTSRPLPREGVQITVKGTVQEEFSIGDKQLIVIVESEPGKPS